MRVVVFASGGPLSLAALRALRGETQVVAVVIPREPMGASPRAWVRSLARRRVRKPLVQAARQLGAPILWSVRGGEPDLEVALRTLAPDLLVVASFPRLLQPSLLAIARLGAVGLHTSLLPRHRGPVPLFWTYVLDDPEAGITLFWLDGGEDTGPLLASTSMPLPRGLPVDDLYPELAEKGAALFSTALPGIAAGTAPRVPQDARLATREAAPQERGHIDYATWNTERVWHVLSGLGHRHPLLEGADGRPIVHGRATGYRLQAHDRPAGSLEPTSSGWSVYCRDGVVDVARGPWWRAVRHRAMPRSSST
jgi:methionyl-tRNA formyltransferase